MAKSNGAVHVCWNALHLQGARCVDLGKVSVDGLTCMPGDPDTETLLGAGSCRGGGSWQEGCGEEDGRGGASHGRPRSRNADAAAAAPRGPPRADPGCAACWRQSVRRMMLQSLRPACALTATGSVRLNEELECSLINLVKSTD